MADNDAPISGAATAGATTQARSVERSSLLVAVTRRILESQADQGLLTEQVFEQVREHLDADVCFGYRLAPEGGLRLIKGIGIPEPFRAATNVLTEGTTFCEIVASTREPLAADRARISGDPCAAFLRAMGVCAYAAHPLIARDGRILGTLCFASTRREAFPAEDVQLMQAICHFLALAWEQRVSEASLRASEERYERVVAAAQLGTWDWDLVTGEIYRSARYYQLLGLSPGAGAASQEQLKQQLHPEDRPHVEEAIRVAIEEHREYHAEYRMRRPDGAEVWLYATGSAICDDEDRPVRMSGVVKDVTDRKRAELALRARERELRMIADSIPDVLARFDRSLRHVFINASVERATGRPLDEFLGKTIRELGRPAELCDLWDGALLRVFASGQPEMISFGVHGPEGAQHYEARLVPEIGLSGAVEHVLSVTHDVTEQLRAAEQLREDSTRKDEFLATLAHELRNPLAPIRTGLAVLSRAGLPDHVERSIAMMERQLGQLVNLVDDLLDVSRVSRGKITLRPERVTLADIVGAAIEACRPLIDAEGHRLTVSLPEEALTFEGDRTRLVQVLTNLLTNAAKYSERGGHITLRAARDQSEAVIEVIDEGLGIAPELLPTIWDMFTQVRDTLEKAQGGLGIGLTLVRRLVEMHSGSVAAESQGVGKGSTFTVRLPLLGAGERPASVHPVSMPVQPSLSAGRRVLVVDDNEDGAEFLAMLLDMDGYTVKTAYSGLEALDAHREFRPEIVFLDIGLPGMNGYEVAEHLRREGSSDPLVLIAITGWGSEDDRRRAKEAGFDHHLTKPVEPSRVEALLASLNAPSA